MTPSIQTTLSTVELFENIISHLPPLEITRVMLVSKSWHNIIKESSLLHNARVLAPSKQQALSTTSSGHITGHPTYPANYELRFHAAFHATQSQNISSPVKRFTLWDGQRDLKYSPAWNHYATMPPVQALGLAFHHRNVSCVIYVKEGVRIRDVVEVADEMKEVEGRWKWSRDRIIGSFEVG